MSKSKKNLEHCGGDGYSRCPDIGNYEVKYGNSTEKSKEFKALGHARRFYDGLNCEKAIWNNYTMELLEHHAYASGERDGSDLKF